MKKNYQKKRRQTSRSEVSAAEAAAAASLADVMADRREGLLALAVQSGLGVMQALFNQDVDRLCGLSGKDNSDRQGYLNGRTNGMVGLGGRRIPITRPRLRSADGSGELPVDSYEELRGTDLLGRMALERMIAGLSTRNNRSGLEPVGAEVEERCVGTGKSSLCRRFIAQTATALAELLARPLNEVDLVALMVDGVHFGEQTCLVALAIDITGVKHRLAIVEGATENATVVRELLAGLGERGLDVTGPILVVSDGAKEPRSAVDDVFDQPIIERCQEHKDPERAGQAASAAAKRHRAADACGLPRREHDCG